MTEDVAEQADTHERIRFRRDEIVDLAALPSSTGIEPPVAPKRKRPRWVRLATWSVLTCAAVVLLLLTSLSYLSHSGFGARQLQEQAEQALRRMVGSDVEISIANAHFALSGPGLLNLELTDVSMVAPGTSEPMLQSADLRLGLDAMSLLTGKVSIASAELARAHIIADKLPLSGGGEGFRHILNKDGLVEPDLLLAAVFSGADVAAKAVNSNGAPDIRLKDISLALGPGLPFASLTIRDALLEQSDKGAALNGNVLFDERPAEFRATVENASGSGTVDKFRIEFTSEREPQAEKSFAFGKTVVSVTGDRSVQGQPAKVFAEVDADELAVDLGTRGRLNGELDMLATLTEATGKIEIDRLDAVIGNSTFRMSGAIGPRPPENTHPEPAYRFELISNESELAPVDTAEPKMPMRMRLAGNYRPDGNLVDVSEVAISTATGAATGNASVVIPETGPPGLGLALDVKGMSVSHVKQLWPWFAAGSARRWVNENLFGGTVPEGGIRLSVAPGRLGDGKKLESNEVSGRFRITGTRFDTTGALPPIRNADGQVSFGGDDVDITLDRGQVFVADGEGITTQNGRLVITNADRPPIIGKLQIDIAGPASAIAKFASLDPINAMQRTGIDPGALSGAVTGTVKANIPLRKSDRSLLDWDVRLGFTGLDVATPIDGQTVRNANGSITVDKTKAAIDAKAELNGVQADLDIVEPLPGGAELRRKREISMALNNQGLRKIAPGLSDVVDGPVKLQIDASDRQSQHVEADLTSAVLSIPAIGWSKGSGVAAKASFDLQRRDSGSQLSGLKLTGNSFGISGSVSVAGGGLSSARFDSFRLNRGDDAAVRIDREGGSYAIVVSGNSLDVRSLIRRATSPGEGGGARKASTPVALRGSIDRLVGFNDEQLSGVTLNYRSGRGGSTLTLSGQTDRGRSVSIETSEGGSSVQSQDAGSLLRFLDIYERVQGGAISARLNNGADGSLSGAVDVSDFTVVNEPKLGSIAAAAPQGAGRRGDNRGIDTSRVRFDRAFANVSKGPSSLRLSDGILRGPTMGATFQGTLYDENNRMQITGTYMPAYGLNSIFGDVPVVGALLGNGEEKGLIGVTYKLTGNAKAPNLQINPLSVIAPGIFRTIFQFQ